MDITLNKDNSIKIDFKKGKEKIEIILFSDSTLKIDEFKISSPGEYEIKEVLVEKIIFFNKDKFTKEEKQLGLLNIQEMKICFLPSKIKELKPEEIERIGDVNLLIININEFDNKKELSQIISQIEPQIIIPFYQNREQLNEFLKAKGVNIEEVEFLNKFSLTSKNLTEEKTKIILLRIENSLKIGH